MTDKELLELADDQVSSVPVTVCIAMSEGGTFLSAFADTHWIQEERKHKDLLQRVREDKQLWSVKYIRTSIQYPITTEKKDKFIGTITNYTDLELRLQAEVAELDEKLKYITLAFSEWIEKTQWVQDTIQPGDLGLHMADVIKSRFDELKAKLAETEQARALIMQTLANTVIERDALKADIAELKAELGDLPEAQADMLSEIKGLKAKLAEAPMTALPNPRVIEIYDTCDQHPDAPHGYLRDASHNAGRYVCECEFWTPGEEL